MQPPSPTLIRCIRAEPGMARPQSNARCGARSNGRRWPTLPDTDRQIPTLNSLSDWHYTNVCLLRYNCPRCLSTFAGAWSAFSEGPHFTRHGCPTIRTARFKQALATHRRIQISYSFNYS